MRKVFYIDVGNLPKEKAEAYIGEIVAKYKSGDRDVFLAKREGAEHRIEYIPDEDQDVRSWALNMALGQHDVGTSPDKIVATAKVFAAYLKGDAK